MSAKTDTRQQILDTAAGLFHSNNYADIGVARVCSDAGVSKGSFFHFFPSKRDLALAVLDQFRERLAARLIGAAFLPSIPPLERFDRFVEELYRYQAAEKEAHGVMPGCPFGNLIAEQASQDENIRAKADGILRSITHHFRATIADAVQGGELPPLDEMATAVAMLAYLEGIQLIAKSRNDPELIRTLGPAVKSIRIASGS